VERVRRPTGRSVIAVAVAIAFVTAGKGMMPPASWATLAHQPEAVFETSGTHKDRESADRGLRLIVGTLPELPQPADLLVRLSELYGLWSPLWIPEDRRVAL
jgi:hypothetical protein